MKIFDVNTIITKNGHKIKTVLKSTFLSKALFIPPTKAVEPTINRE